MNSLQGVCYYSCKHIKSIAFNLDFQAKAINTRSRNRNHGPLLEITMPYKLVQHRLAWLILVFSMILASILEYFKAPIFLNVGLDEDKVQEQYLTYSKYLTWSVKIGHIFWIPDYSIFIIYLAKYTYWQNFSLIC